MAPAQWEVEIGRLQAAFEGCQKRDSDERARTHARVDALESSTTAIQQDLTFLRGRLSGLWMVLLAVSAAGGAVSGAVALFKVASGG